MGWGGRGAVSGSSEMSEDHQTKGSSFHVVRPCRQLRFSYLHWVSSKTRQSPVHIDISDNLWFQQAAVNHVAYVCMAADMICSACIGNHTWRQRHQRSVSPAWHCRFWCFQVLQHRPRPQKPISETHRLWFQTIWQIWYCKLAPIMSRNLSSKP